MKIDSTLKAHVQKAFAPLDNQAAANAFSAPAALSGELNKAVDAGALAGKKTATIALMFSTAAVDMWLRAVHSFLISASLTNVSPIWACVTGYYSSHYTVRSIAHLLGFFQLFQKKQIVRLELQNTRFVCTFDSKAARDKEHRYYWKVVKSSPLFAADPFFTQNPPGDDASDVAHRNWANYVDHLSSFPTFQPLDPTAVKHRIEKISDIVFQAVPIPRVSLYPDTESVQIIAYHRLVRFRDLLDAIVGTGHRFWSVHRNPPWARGFMDFQVADALTLRSEFIA